MDKREEEPFAKCAREMAQMLYSDSGIPEEVSYERILRGLRDDARVPSLYEMECLTMGGPLNAEVTGEQPDTEGEGNPEVDARFPSTNAEIEELF